MRNRVKTRQRYFLASLVALLCFSLECFANLNQWTNDLQHGNSAQKQSASEGLAGLAKDASDSTLNRLQAAEALVEHNPSFPALHSVLENFLSGRSPLLYRRALDHLEDLHRSGTVTDAQIAYFQPMVQRRFVHVMSTIESRRNQNETIGMRDELGQRMGEFLARYPNEQTLPLLQRWVQLSRQWGEGDAALRLVQAVRGNTPDATIQAASDFDHQIRALSAQPHATPFPSDVALPNSTQTLGDLSARQLLQSLNAMPPQMRESRVASLQELSEDMKTRVAQIARTEFPELFTLISSCGPDFGRFAD